MSEIRIRSVVASDLEALVELETRAMHFPMGHHVREWFRPDHPGDIPQRFAVAEHDGRIVSIAALLPVLVTYRGIPLSGGMWEAVVTDEAYRRRGLCRRLFTHLETSFPADLLVVQGLTWLYRRFGYHPALRSHGGWDSAGHVVRPEDLPGDLPGDLTEPRLAFRPALPGDATFLVELLGRSAARSIVFSPTTESTWRYALRPDRTVAGPGETGLNRWREWRILLDGDEPVGAFAHDPWDLAMLTHLEIIPGRTMWREAGAATIRAVATFAGKETVRVTLPPAHPLFAAYPRAFERTFRGYGDWATRIPDAVGFLRKVAPVLEANLAASALAGWSGELTLSRIEDALTLTIERGRVARVEPRSGERPDHARVRLPPGRFEALVLGYRSIAATLAEDADAAADEEAEAVLAALFPPGDSAFRPM